MLSAAPAFAQHPNHTATVAAVKAQLESAGVDLSGPCGAFEITKRVAWTLRLEGAGTLSKPSGNNCEGMSVDYILYQDGDGFDILGDAGGTNAPGWGGPEEGMDVTRWRAPVNPRDLPPDPTPVPPTPVPPPDLQPILDRLNILEQSVVNLNSMILQLTAALEAQHADLQTIDAKVNALHIPSACKVQFLACRLN